jgi:hypothetical protein
MTTWRASGPFGRENEVQAAARRWDVPLQSWQGDTDAWRTAARQAMYDRLREALLRTATPIGDYDARTVQWLAGWEVATTEVVAGLIERAYEAGLRAARTDRAAIEGHQAEGEEGH